MLDAGTRVGVAERLPPLPEAPRDYPSMTPILSGLLPTSYKPSDYIAERCMSTATFLSHHSALSFKTPIIEFVSDNESSFLGSAVSNDTPLFEPFPNHVILQGFTPFKTYEVVVRFRNNDKVARRFRIDPLASVVFSISSLDKTGSLQSSGKVAPGMETDFILRFTPEELNDYSIDIVCVTEREKFLLPVRAIGARAILDFPDEVTFGESPVRYKSIKTLLVRNIGQKNAKFQLKTNEPFDVDTHKGYIQTGDHSQIDITYEPKDTGTHSQILCVEFDTGEQILVQLVGTAENMNVRLEKGSLKMDDTYITLKSSKKITLLNNSNLMVKFHWKHFPTEDEELQYRERQASILIDNKLAEREILGSGSDNSLALRLMRNCYQSILEEHLLFSDKIFKVEPQEGTIWPNKSFEFSVTFSPIDAGLISKTIYCEVGGRETRLPLCLKGEGIGPKVRFSFDFLDIEEVYVSSIHQYEVILENFGKIDAKYHLVQPSEFSRHNIVFKPRSGVLSAGQSQTIVINVYCDTIGSFHEEFKWSFEGSNDPLLLVCCGNIIGPSFSFDIQELDYSDVSYGFLTSKCFHIQNNSKISMDFNIYMHIDGVEDDSQNSEFLVVPSNGKIDPFNETLITVHFTPKKLHKYLCNLFVDTGLTGTVPKILPVKAESVVPQVALEASCYDLGNCFLNHAYFIQINLINESSLFSQYTVKQQDEQEANCTYECDIPTGIIQPHVIQSICLKFTAITIGHIESHVAITISGTVSPLLFSIYGQGIGPDVTINTNEICFGKIHVLKNCAIPLEISNNSPIIAEFECSLLKDDTVFNVQPSKGTISSNTSNQLVVSAYLDDVIQFSDILQIKIKHGQTFNLNISAKGNGTTIVYDKEVKHINFGNVFSKKMCATSFTVTNCGRRSQSLHWIHQVKKGRIKLPPSELHFSVFPKRLTLEPGASHKIEVEGTSLCPVDCEEIIICNALLNNDPIKKKVLACHIAARFIDPLIELSSTSLEFSYLYSDSNKFPLLSQPLTLKNLSPLPLSISIKAFAPYSVTPGTSVVLDPQCETTLSVNFDTLFHEDCISCDTKSKIFIAYEEHSQSDFVEVHSSVVFPNITFSSSVADFGSVIVETEHRQTYKMENTSSLPVHYEWQLHKTISANCDSEQIYDISPLCGLIEPGHTEYVEISFFTKNAGVYEATAICTIQGGPNYELAIRGKASELKYEVGHTILDFGTQLYQAIVEKELVLSNLGNVPFEFSLHVFDSIANDFRLALQPATAILAAFSEQKITVKFCLCLPKQIRDEFYIKVAHLEPIKIIVMGLGIYPKISLDLHEVKDISTIPKVKNQKILELELSKTHRNEKQNEENMSIEVQDDEREKVRLCEQINTHLKQILAESKANYPIMAKFNYTGSPVIINRWRTAKKSNKGQKIQPSLYELSKIKISTYICDFVNVVRSTTKRKSIRITNQSSKSISIHFECESLSQSGFSIEPERLKLIPKGESADVIITFQAKNHVSDKNSIEEEVLICVAGGPITILRLKAELTVPELLISSTSLDFGEVVCGFRKTITIHIQNPKSVPCEWHSTLNHDQQNVQSCVTRREFDISPESGILQPGESTFLAVQFYPHEERLYEQWLQIKITLNSKLLKIHVQGAGKCLTLNFDPDMLSMGPVLPYAEAVESKVLVSNPTDYLVEFYSVEYDKQYVDEETALKKIEGFGPGAPLYVQCTDFHESRIKYFIDSKLSPKETFNANLTKSDVLVEQVDGKPAIECPAVVILHGPPLSGRSTQAKMLQARYGFKVLKIDDLFERAGDILSDTSLYQKVPDTSFEIGKHPRVTVEIDRTEVGHSESIDHTTDDTIFENLRYIFCNDSGAKVIVIDGLESKMHTNVLSILKSLLHAIPEKKKCFLVHLTLDILHIRERESNIQKVIIEKEEERANRFKSITEVEYDSLSDLEKETYNATLMQFRKRMKELQNRKKLERQQWEEELAIRLGDRKDEESKGKGKRAGGGRRSNVNRDLKTEKPEKTAPSPGGQIKISKANVSERGSTTPKSRKFLEKTDRLQEGEEYASRITLNDGNDIFGSESIFRRFEHYQNNVDGVIAVAKDTEKSLTNGQRILNVSTTPEKRAPKGKISNVVLPGSNQTGFDTIQSSLANQNESDSHMLDEQCGICIYEISANLDQEAVFKTISDIIPIQLKQVDSCEKEVSLPDPLLEQIVRYPTQSVTELNILPCFSLLPSSYQNETDEESLLDPVTQQHANATLKPDHSNKKQKIAQVGKQQVPISIQDEANTPEDSDQFDKQAQNSYRWRILPHEKKELTVRFMSVCTGRFKQNMRFRINGASNTYSFECLGICEYSSLISDPKHMFTNVRANKDDRAIIHGEYVLNTNTFEFGPLLHSKPREKYLEKFPENRCVVNLTNIASADCRINIYIKNDIRGDVFFFDPSSIDVSIGQTIPLTIWAYPRQHNYCEDTIVICVKDNPEPIIFKISCIGVKPELEVDKKILSFDKLLLSRTEKREMKLKNPTWMPIWWKLIGIEGLGEEFSISPIEGIIDPFQECIVSAEFKGLKPIVVKKVIKIEVSDLDKVGGIFQEYTIVVTAEAYDIAMDLHFPKGYDGGFDFGVTRVCEEVKQMCSLKNKGKYEVGFRFNFETKDFSELISIQPQQGIMQPSDKPFPVQFVFKANKELSVKDNAGLKCQFFEPGTGEVTSTTMIKICARSVFSKFLILPMRDLNFGAVVHGGKVLRQFTIDNTGEFDFRFAIFKATQGVGEAKGIGKLRTQSRLSKSVRPNSPPGSRPSNRKDIVKQADAVNFGPFTIYPNSGVVSPSTRQTITVEFHSENPGNFEEVIAIDISERSVNEIAEIIGYRIIGESCLPGINTLEFASIFEEHMMCKRLELFTTQTNIYAEEERVFYFGAFLAGNQVSARFKISNPFKVTCDVLINTKPRTRVKSDLVDFAFDVEPKRLVIPSHEHRYVVVSFHPMSIQSYAGVFEATVENVAESRFKTLTFELRGEGTLPHIIVENPTGKTTAGLYLLDFHRKLIGSSNMKQIILRNDGVIPAKIQSEWIVHNSTELELKAASSYVTIQPFQIGVLDIEFRPTIAHLVEGKLRIKIVDNMFDEHLVHISGEGYFDDISFDEISEGKEENVINFGDCYVDHLHSKSIKMCNNSDHYFSIQWAENSYFTILPFTFILLPKMKQEVCIEFIASQPTELIKQPLLCKASKIRVQDKNTLKNYTKLAMNDKLLQHKRPLLAGDTLELIGTPNEYLLHANVLADYCSYECSVHAISFKNTLMYQTRSYTMYLKNTGRIALSFKTCILASEVTSHPFSVSPKNGTVAAGDSAPLIVKFSPTDVAVYKGQLEFILPNTQKEFRKYNIPLSGASLRPFCHFELENSDYLIGERRNPEVGISNGIPMLDNETRVIEFQACGIRSKNLKKFFILNPTDAMYEIEWNCSAGNLDQNFRCLTPRGIVLPQKKFEVTFEYFPDSVQTKEALWDFSIPAHNIVVRFLVVGCTREPNIIMNQAHINFRSILVGRHSKEIVNLMNMEDVPFSFSFSDMSLEMGTNGDPVLQFSPDSGTISGNGEVPVEIIFTPAAEKLYNFNMMCIIKQKPTPVTLNVKGEGYLIHETVMSELIDGATYELTTVRDNVVDFGKVQVMEKRIKRIIIMNSGKFNFDFSWKYLNPQRNSRAYVSITPEIGTVPKGEKLICEITFFPSAICSLKGQNAILQIANGKQYLLSFQGIGSMPVLTLSKFSHDFGSQFLYKPGVTSSTTIIMATNDDICDIAFDVIFADGSVFEAQKGVSAVLSPKQSTEIEFRFLPREKRKYYEIVKIQINSTSAFDVVLQGEGVLFSVELIGHENKNVNFGSLHIGQIVKRTAKLINNSPIPAAFKLGPKTLLEQLAASAVSVFPNMEISLPPKGIINVEFKFQPVARLLPFIHELSIEAPGILQPLLIIIGACQGIEVKLENDTLPFGAVVQKSSTTRRLQLQNIGDIGVKFHWDYLRFSPDFSITPIEGYISPGMEIALEITFHPTEVNPDIRYENILCHIDSSLPVTLTLSGICVPQPTQTEIIKFSTPVRQSETKSVSLVNKSTSIWRLHPIIENDYWSGQEVLEIEAGQAGTYDVVFNPQTMTGDGENGRHEGTLFFPLPDGNGILYKLSGFADKPVPAGVISRELPSKTLYTEIFNVENWLKRPQRFKVIMDIPKADPSIVLKGNDFIDVQGHVSKEYKLQFFAYKEGVTNLKLIFKNESTQEYLLYSITFKSTPPGVIGMIDMSTVVRQSCLRDIMISNPLTIPITFSATCNHPDLLFPHPISVLPRSEGVCQVEYCPLHPRESIARFVLLSSDLGAYQYDLKLNASPASPEKSLHFKVNLGGNQTQTFRFISFSKVRTEYSIKIDSTEFVVDKSVIAPPASSSGIEISIDILYEPSKLGDVRTQLLISSPIGGEYFCPLFGHCGVPKPQGPILIKAGTSSTVGFKNVFAQSATFNLAVDNPVFTVKQVETIPAKKNIHISITYKPSQSTRKAVGRLTISHSVTNVNWIIYLSGQ
ncbi:hypothetical protein BJ742DRAFT_498091 [Cladochytrium replicatum]|nr:hypothetical protein BJ742DRAFT_498091 [Cladochytrium replicatum]